MTHPRRSAPSLSTGWKLFGELELPPDQSADQKLNQWLPETLNTLNLPASLVNKILTAAQQAVERARQTLAGVPARSFCLLFFTPESNPVGGQTWGFFSIEKMAGEIVRQTAPLPTIEFYLYPEG